MSSPPRAAIGDWELIQQLRSPWDEIPVTAGGKSLTPGAQQYLDRLLSQQDQADPPSRRHHFVPRTYLKHWSQDGSRVWALNTATGVAKQMGVADVCVKENFHRVTGGDGEPHNRVELIFRVVDAELHRVQRLLQALQRPDDLSFEDFMAIGVTVAVQRIRTLQQRRIQQQYSEWLTAQNSQEFSPWSDTAESPHLVAGIHTRLVFKAMWDAADVMTTRQLEIWDDSKGRFLTSDVPVVVPFRAGVRPSMLAAPHVIWPISPYRAVVLSNDLTEEKATFRQVTAKVAAAIREAVIQGRELMIFATEDQLRYLPIGKPQRRRAQVRLRCSHWSPRGKYVPPPGCVVEFSEGYGAGPDVALCESGLHRPAPGMLHRS